ncbi:glutaredoxin family protein [Sanguibacter sp. Leaf3]|uniref:glutaredoxin family protein n=1 Tax=Sanguibacter sp. Leaf3 TaxID=1736209 RepID=UPI0009EC2B87|nr:glutaredoxin family protein [Sanguibacter sp. Leaf3]
MSTRSTVTVYSKSSCPQCTATYRWLDRRGIPYEVLDATDPETLTYLRSEGHSAAPVVEVFRGGAVVRSWAGFRVGELEDLEVLLDLEAREAELDAQIAALSEQIARHAV